MAKTAQEKADLKAEKLYEKTHKNIYRTSVGDQIFNAINYVVYTLFTIICIFPFYYLFINTISDNDLVIKGLINFIPRGIHFGNYAALLNVSDLMSSFIVSVTRTVFGTALMVAASAFIGYLVTQQEMWGRKVWYRFIVITMYFNAGLIPWFLNMQMLGLTNTYWAYIIPGIVAPYNIILVKTYIESIPKELEESAKIDGASHIRIFAQIIWPLSKPILATIAIFGAVGNWNSFTDSLILMSSKPELYTLQHRLYIYLKGGAGMGEKKRGFFSRLVEGLTKTRDSIVSGIDSVFSGFSAIDDDFYEEIEETLIMGDLGIQTTMAIVEDLRKKVKENHIKDPAECKDLLIASIKEQMDLGENAYEFENRKSVVLVIGVNGVGKTTSVGKLAGQLKDQGKKVILAAADTFRAAAIEQLTEWAGRAGVELIAQQEGSDPAAVIYDAIAAAKSRNADVLICDTAGRLHNKKNLMEELKKINRIIDKEYPDAYRETLVVLDGTTGQNALAQAKQFMEVADITGIILTKLDGTAKGGIAVAIQSELGIPVKYVGIGEKIDDLQKFDANDFVNALFKRNEALTENE